MPISIAALVAGWAQRDKHGIPSTPPIGAGPIAGPLDPIGLTVELNLGTLGWTDISPFVLYRDSSVLVSITRGRPNETSSAQPQTATFQVNNRDGRFSPRNPTGPYYRNIGRNTQVRISRMQNGVRRYRFCGEVVSWPTTWDISGNDVWIDVPAAGMLRRLQQGTQTLGSAMYRAYALREAGSLNPVAYWPCEDGATSTSFASGIRGNPAMVFTGAPQLASNSSFVCSLPLPALNASVWTGAVPAASGWTDNVMRFLVAAPTGGETDNTVLARMSTTGTVKRVELIYHTASGLQLKGYDANGNTLFDTGNVGPYILNGTVSRLSLALRTSGANVGYEIQQLIVGGASATVTSGTLSTATIGPVTSVSINPSGVLTGTAIGHVSVQSTWDTLFDLGSQLAAWNDQDSPGTDRMPRLCSEEGVNYVPITLGQFGNTVTMGYQTSDTLANLLQQCADSDTGILHEARDQLALAYRTRLSLQNQGTTYNPQRGLTLDYAQAQLSGPLDPLDDDANTRNDVTVQRMSGSFAQAVDSSPLDALSTQPPPQGVGDYATTYSLSIGNDAQLPDHAHWRLHLGTVDEPRYPSIMLNLRHPQFTGNLDLMNQAVMMDIGDLVVINNPPAWMPPDQIRQILQGYTETLGIFEHDMVLNCTPEAPYRVGVVGDTVLGHADTDGSTLAAPVAASSYDVLVAADTPSAWWKLADAAGSATAADSSGNGRTGTASSVTFGNTSQAIGSNNSASFTSGSSSHILTSYNPAMTSVTVELWVNLNSVAPSGSPRLIANSHTDADSNGFQFMLSGGNQPQIWFGTGGSSANVLAPSTLPSSGWTHLAATWDQVTVMLYVNGAVAASQAFAGTMSAGSASGIGIGYNPTYAGDYVSALLAEVAVYPVALSGADILAHYQSTPANTLSVASTNPLLPAWTTSAGAFPFDINVGGERMTVTNITGSSSPQSFTVARSVNQVVKPQSAGTDVRLWQPATVSM